ncbi:extracellular solute-binding protein family 1 [Thermobaculum terrenum ATCC BAA-798]|uniref:Extracellular solute-binding protein family 1 n=1 Tax=Thermobaculum terrenum (strain ATCC BAA-798 / CCMEE 7001 / YNP1) TaxID=525904 RepID=D1CHI1_THET1|nr:sugar ABC transporter substrate-binding protein [Thermobaculum terrenum]ACZ43202.1 extracellular solute-binding protein family 1 [Thermobaculum terrenum ATCC BAA-798]
MNTRRISRRDFMRNAILTSAGIYMAGCGMSSTSKPASSPTVSSQATHVRMQGTLQIAFVGTQVANSQKVIAQDFEKAHPGVKINFLPIQGKDWNDYFTKILTQIASGSVPDLMTVATEGIQLFAGKGLAYPLDEFVKQDKEAIREYFADVHPSLVEAMMYQGHLYALPFDFNAANMFLNMNLFSQAGIEYPRGNWTKDDFYDIAKKIAALGGDGAPYGYGWVIRLWGSWTPWIYNNRSNLLKEDKWQGGQWLWDTFYPDNPAAKGRSGGWRWGEPIANTPENVEALDFMVQLAKEHITPSISAGGGGLLQGFFTSDKLGMTPAGGFWAGGLHNAGMKPDEFDVQFFPKWQTQRHLFGTAGLVMMEKSKNKDLAWEYIKYWVSKPVMQYILSNNDTTPVRRSLATAKQYANTGPKHWSVFYDTLTKFPDTAPIPAPTWYERMNTIFTKYTSLAMSFSQTPQQALDNMQKEMEQAYEQEGGK